jgi:hypothetical protein
MNRCRTARSSCAADSFRSCGHREEVDRLIEAWVTDLNARLKSGRLGDGLTTLSRSPLDDEQRIFPRISDGPELDRVVKGHETPASRGSEREQIEIGDLSRTENLLGVHNGAVQKRNRVGPKLVVGPPDECTKELSYGFG